MARSKVTDVPMALAVKIELFKRGCFDFITVKDGLKHEKQEHALKILTDNEHVELLYGGAAGGAKSWTGVVWLLFMCLCYPGSKWFIGRAELKRITQSTLITFYKVCNTGLMIPCTSITGNTIISNFSTVHALTCWTCNISRATLWMSVTAQSNIQAAGLKRVAR